VTDYRKLTRPVWPRVADPWKDEAPPSPPVGEGVAEGDG
jgi:hypothetical protein